MWDSVAANAGTQASVRQQLRNQLLSLPKPKNEFEIVLPDLPADEGGDDADDADAADGGDGAGGEAEAETEEDAADVDARQQSEAKRRADEEFRSRSVVLQRNLPRPTTVNVAALEAAVAKASSPFDALVQAELLAMLRHDAAVFPPKGAPHAPPAKVAAYERMARDELSEAAALIEAEMKALAVEVDPAVYESLHGAAASDFIFVPSTQQMGRASLAPKADRVASLRNELEVRAPCPARAGAARALWRVSMMA